MPLLTAHSLLLCIVGLSILLMLLRPRGIPEVFWVGGGALLLIALRLIPLRLAAHAIAKGTDVYLFLAGMMLLSEIARENGVFDWIAAIAVTHALHSARRLFLLLYIAGVCVTACLSNDATAIVLTPAVLASVRRARVNPLPFLFACAMVANAASFVLPISNPANLVVFHAAMPPLARWLTSFLLPSLCSILATYITLRWYFARSLDTPLTTPPLTPRPSAAPVIPLEASHPDATETSVIPREASYPDATETPVMPREASHPDSTNTSVILSEASHRDAQSKDPAPARLTHTARPFSTPASTPGHDDPALTRGGRLVLYGLALVVVILLITSALGRDLGLPTFLAALAIAGAATLHTRSNPAVLLKEISWSTLALVAALFILVEAADSVGALRFTRDALAYAQHLAPATGALLTAFVVGIANNLINNLPLGLIAADTLAATHIHGLLAQVILIAVDLGPNLSVTGSLATILWLLALRREGLNVTFLDFLKIGALAMPAALLAAVAARLALYTAGVAR